MHKSHVSFDHEEKIAYSRKLLKNAPTLSSDHTLLPSQGEAMAREDHKKVSEFILRIYFLLIVMIVLKLANDMSIF